MKKSIVSTLVAVMGLATSSVYAAAGDSTVSLGYAQFKAPGLKDAITLYNDSAFAYFDDTVSQYLSPAAYQAVEYTGSEAKHEDPKGFNLKYRYELTDELGVMASFTWARAKSDGHVRADLNYNGVTADAAGKLSVKGTYWSLQAGPAYRINEYASVYALAGVASSKVSADLNITGSYAGESLGSDHQSISESKTSAAWTLGAQFNPLENVAIDVAYEGSGSGDWRTNGFVIGLGYKF